MIACGVRRDLRCSTGSVSTPSGPPKRILCGGPAAYAPRTALSVTELFRSKMIPINPNYKNFGRLLALGFLVLALIHWCHSWEAFKQGVAFADLGGSYVASTLLEIGQTLTLAFLLVLYLTALVNWHHWKFGVREVVSIGSLPTLFAWSALPANSTDLLAYIGLGRLAGTYRANPYLHTYSEFADSYSSFLDWDITMPYGPVVLPAFMLAGWISFYSIL